MNKLNLVMTATAFATLAGCAHSHKRADNPPPTPQQQAVSQLDADRAAYVAGTQARIDEMTKFSTQLRDKAATAQKPQKKKLENAADDMDASLKDVEKELTDVRQAAPENWLDEKRDVTKTMQRAETQYNDSIRLLQ